MKNFSPLFVVLIMVSVWSCSSHDPQQEKLPLLKVSENKRFLADENNQPFFWLGDTGWLLFKKLSREEADRYLENRKQKGFNLIQVMVLHDLADNTNFYGDAPFVGDDVSEPLVTLGNSPDDSTEYDFWDHVDYIHSTGGGKRVVHGPGTGLGLECEKRTYYGGADHQLWNVVGQSV